ncbi:MAG TPA: alpha/beta hydrolase, partial [Fodinibius sp.]|nr:alpha/beta hydrolase [Fodinibius sp.]
KPGTEAHIVWNDSKKQQQTDLSIVYLHGFKASHPEGHPVHKKIAQYLGANLYLSRLQEHGLISDHPLQELTEQKLLQSARHALTIGEELGKKVLLMGTSTGGSLALYLAAQPNLQQNIAGLILYSPLIRFYGLNDKILKYSLPRSLLRIIPGRSYLLRTHDTTEAEDRIWDASYSLQGVLALANFVSNYMHSGLFAKVKVPTFAGYYYKNKRNQDKVVSVSAIKMMLSRLGSKPSDIQSANFPKAASHVICSSLTSKSVPDVIHETKTFLKDLALHGDNRKALT